MSQTIYAYVSDSAVPICVSKSVEENASETPSNCRTGDQSPINVAQSHIDTLQDDHLSYSMIVDQPESDIPIDVQSAFGNTTDIDGEQIDSYSVATQIDVPNAPPRPEKYH